MKKKQATAARYSASSIKIVRKSIRRKRNQKKSLIPYKRTPKWIPFLLKSWNSKIHSKPKVFGWLARRIFIERAQRAFFYLFLRNHHFSPIVTMSFTSLQTPSYFSFVPFLWVLVSFLRFIQSHHAATRICLGCNCFSVYVRVRFLSLFSPFVLLNIKHILHIFCLFICGYFVFFFAFVLSFSHFTLCVCEHICLILKCVWLCVMLRVCNIVRSTINCWLLYAVGRYA